MAEAQLTNQLTRIDSMTNVELRGELKRRGCPTSGNKKDLLAKLRVALQKEFEQASLETASTTSTIDSMSLDGRNNNNLQQSPVVSYDINRSSLNNSTMSSNNYMTPHSGSPIVYSQQIHSGEVPLTYSNLQMHDQTTGQYPSVYNLPMHQSPAPMIPVPQQLTISPSERQHLYDQSLLQNQQQYTPMNTRQGRTSVDVAPMNTLISPTAPLPSPEKRSRSRSKRSVDSLIDEIPEQQDIPLNLDSSLENLPTEIIYSTPVQQLINNEQMVIESTTNNNNGNNIEMNPFVSKSNDEEQKDIEKEREDRGDSRSPSVGSSSAKSESVIKEIPLSGERHRLSRSKSPKSRWHHSPSPQQPPNQSATIEGEQNSATAITNNDNNITNEKSSIVTLFAEEMVNLSADEKKQDESTSAKQPEISKKEEELPLNNNEQPEKGAAQQQLKPSRSQTSSSSSLTKGFNRSTTSNRMNLSSDILKTLIPNINLASESSINDELEKSTNEQGNGDDVEHSPNPGMLETSVATGFLFSDSMTIGELADQKQQRNRTVVMDVAADSSSLNDDLVSNNSDIRKKNQTPGPPARVASFESKPLLDGKTNALMMDEPVRVKDATATREPASQIVYIRGLTRPFTLPQLKELLSHYGALVDGEFWLDKIKSQCFVTYNTLEEAQNAREALDGCRWPSTNPKTLSVRFGRQDEFEFSKTHDLPPDQMSIDAMDTTNNRLVHEKSASHNKISASSRRSTSPADDTKINNKKVRPSGNSEVREWDLPKMQQEKDETTTTERNVIEEQSVKPNEPPAKSLDDYFRKTKAKPAIYWLPLSEEQIIERTRRQEQRNAERDEEQKKRQIDETARVSNSNKDSKPRSNTNENSSSKRRSISPKDKRKRVLSNSSPARRDNKRH